MRKDGGKADYFCRIHSSGDIIAGSTTNNFMTKRRFSVLRQTLFCVEDIAITNLKMIFVHLHALRFVFRQNEQQTSCRSVCTYLHCATLFVEI